MLTADSRSTLVVVQHSCTSGYIEPIYSLSFVSKGGATHALNITLLFTHFYRNSNKTTNNKKTGKQYNQSMHTIADKSNCGILLFHSVIFRLINTAIALQLYYIA